MATMKRTILTLAVIVAAGIVEARTMLFALSRQSNMARSYLTRAQSHESCEVSCGD
jgi:hypothetical protein